MNPTNLVLSLLAFAFTSMLARADQGSYFEFIQPTQGTEWQNGKTNPIIWKKGLLDSINMFDLEIARLSQDGILKVALNVEATSSKGNLNVYIEDVPAGDDYYLLFINSTHGGMYAISPRFTVLDASASVDSSAAASSPVSGATTVSISGGPNPTAQFAQTFAAISNALAWRFDTPAKTSAMGIVVAMGATVVGAAWTLL